jgi:hypothetical protein
MINGELLVRNAVWVFITIIFFIFAAIVHRNLSHFEESRKLHKEALDGYLKVGDKLGICESCEGIAALLFHLER